MSFARCVREWAGVRVGGWAAVDVWAGGSGCEFVINSVSREISEFYGDVGRDLKVRKTAPTYEFCPASNRPIEISFIYIWKFSRPM